MKSIVNLEDSEYLHGKMNGNALSVDTVFSHVSMRLQLVYRCNAI